MPKATTPAAPQRLHTATFARDKRNPGQYLIRVLGPTAGAFAGREIPVTRADHSESIEKLINCVWSGVDDKAVDGRPATNKPVALYTFEQKPRVETPPDALPF